MKIHIREIEPQDNPTLAHIIRSSLEEFGANKKGTVYYDDSTDHLYELFQAPKSKYFVAVLNDIIAGGAGIFPTEGLPETVCELVKMYLVPQARGLRIGSELMQKCFDYAGNAGFNSVYIETLPELSKAVSVYHHFGFKQLDKPMGDSKHTGCSIWMLKSISALSE